MPPDEYRPITDRNPPFALGGLAVGLVFAVVVGVTVKLRAPAPPAPHELAPAPVAQGSPPPAPAPTTRAQPITELPVRALPPLAAPERSSAALPPLPGASRGHSGSESVTVDVAISPYAPSDIAAYYRSAFGDCARSWQRDNVDVVACSGDRATLEAIIVPHGGGSEIYAETVLLRAVPARHVARGSDRSMCSSALHFLDLPDDATPRGSSAGNVEGTCELTMPDAPSTTMSELGQRIAGSLNSFDVSGDSTLHAIAMNVGAFWQIDAAPGSDGGSHVVVQRIDTERVPAQMAFVGHPAKMLALRMQCHASCAGDVMAVEDAQGWDAAADRCLYECAGEPGAPARVAPVDAFMPTHRK